MNPPTKRPAPPQTGAKRRSPASVRRWVLAYDIADNRRRRRVARLLEGNAQRIQRSVFSTSCTQHETVGLLRKAGDLLEPGDQLGAWPVVAVPDHLSPPWQKRLAAAKLPDYWIV